MTRWCQDCRNELAVAPTDYCAACLHEQIAALARESELLVIELPAEPLDPVDVWLLMYPTFGGMTS